MNDIDLNNNGVPDWAEERQDDWENHPTDVGSPFSFAYENEQQVADLVPDYKNYKWYKQPEENYYYSYGEKIENLIENKPEESKEMLEQIAENDNGISKEDVQPLIKEAEQVTDGDERTSEVNDETVEQVIKNPKIAGFLDDIGLANFDEDDVIDEEDWEIGDEFAVPEKDVSSEEYEKMSLDDIEKEDEKAIKGEGPYLTVADSIDPDNRYAIDDSLNDFAEERYSVNWPTKETLGDRSYEYTGKEIPENEEEEENKDDNSSINVPEIGGNVNTDYDFQNDNVKTNESSNVKSGVGTTSPNFSGGTGSGYSMPSGVSVNTDAGNTNDYHSNAGGYEAEAKVAKMDGNIASFNGTNRSEHIDNTFDSLGFKETQHEGSIKSSKSSLPSKEGHTSSGGGSKLNIQKNSINENPLVGQIVEKIISLSRTWPKDKDGWKTSGEKYLPFKFFVNNDSVEMTEIASGERKKPIANWIANQPSIIKRIQQRIG